MNILETILRYFNLRSDLQGKSRGSPGTNELFLIIPQYIALVLGILVQPFFSAYQQSAQWHFEGVLGRMFFAVLAGIVILPSVYKNSFDPEKPIIIQLCLLFVAGLGWQSLLGAAISAVGPPAK